MRVFGVGVRTLGKRHLDYLLSKFVVYYNSPWSSMVRDHLPPVRDDPEVVETLKPDQVEVRSHVGGLAKSFQRKAV